MDWDRHTIVGTSQEIFKDYLRLTTVRSKIGFDNYLLMK